MKQRNESELLHLAAAYCSATERCISDVRKKITTAGGQSEIADRIISYLLKEKFIDEARYCRSFVNDKLLFNHWGRIRISYELRKKEISPSLVAEAIDNINENNYVNILSELLIIKKRTTKGNSGQDVFNKLYRFAASRGFESDIILKHLKPMFPKSHEADNME